MRRSSIRQPFFVQCLAPLLQYIHRATVARMPSIKPRQLTAHRHAVAVLVLCAQGLTVGCATLTPKLMPGHVGFIAASAGDVFSTKRALAVGATERNPFLGEQPGTGKIIALKVGGWVAMRTIERAVEKEIGRDLKWWENVLLWIIPTGVSVWATQHNMRVAGSYQ